MIICESSQKPLMLFHLIHSHNLQNSLVFTKSAESTARLVQLLDFFEQSRAQGSGESNCRSFAVRAYSSDLAAGERKSILDKFKSQDIQM